MPLLIADRVKETSAVVGTVDAVLAGAVSGFRTFASVLANGDTTYYTIEDAANGAWEVGLGTYTTATNTLARTTVLASSAGGTTKVNFAAGTKHVFITAAAETLPPNNRVTNTARSASFSSTLTTVVSDPVPANSITAGSQYYFRVVALITNTTTASNLTARLDVGATAVVTLTQALGTTARTSLPILIEGTLTFTSATTAEAYIRAFTSAAVVFDVAAANTAAVTVATNADTSVNMKLQTSTVSSSLIVTQATIEKVK